MSIWDKLDHGGVQAVSLPGPRTPRTRAVPSAPIDPATVRVTVVDVADPDDLEPPPPATDELLRRICAGVRPALRPGYLALFPAGATPGRSPIAIANERLLIDGEPVFDRPFALLRIWPDEPDADAAEPAAGELDLLADLDELERDRERMHLALAAGDRPAGAAALHGLIDRIAAQPGLADSARWRLVRGVEREFLALRHAGHGAAAAPLAGWKDFVGALPPTRAGDHGPIDAGALLSSLTPRMATDAQSVAGGGEPEAPPVHWNTLIRDDAGAPIDDELTAGRTYTIANKLDPAPAADAYFDHTEVKVALADDTQVTFVVECPQPVLRAQGATAWVERVEQQVTYTRATGETPAAVVELRSEPTAKLSLAFSMLTDGTTRASGRTRLLVKAAPPAAAAPAPALAASSAADAAPAASTPRQRALTAAAFRGKAELHLDLTAANQLQLRAGAVVGPPCTPHKPARDLVNVALLARNDLVELALRYAPDGAAPPFGLVDGPAAITEMATIGARLHAAFFGLPGQRLDANLRELAERIASTADARLQLVAAFQPFPWNVFYDGAWRDPPVPPERAADDPSGFWGRRFRIDRAIVGHMPAVPRLELAGPLRVQPCINPNLHGRARNHTIAVVEPQRKLFADFAADDVAAAAPIERDADLVAYLRAQPGPCDLFYFMGHAESAASLDEQFAYAYTPADDQARLVLDRAGGTTVARMAELRQAPLDDRPLVFLNACSSVAGDQAFAPPLLAQFLDQWSAAGVLGTDWQVPATFADAFARRLLEYFVRERRPLAAALASARDDAFAQRNPFALVYALYAPPDLVRSPAAP
jgi:hypothetical protein